MKQMLNGVSGRTVRFGASVLCLCLALSACDMVASADKLKADASAALTARNYSSAAQIAQKWSEKTPDHYEAFFVLAQAQAQAGDKNAALVALEQAIKKGLKDDAQIDSNTNLDPIKEMSAYASLMKASFPDRKTPQEEAEEAKPEDKDDDSEVSITEKDGQQVLRAGDVVIQMPVDK
jgi:hypothetical protein